MRTTFEDMPLKWPLISIILGVYAITAFGFGYLGLSRWMEDYSKIASVIMYISAVFFSDIYSCSSYYLWTGGMVICENGKNG